MDDPCPQVFEEKHLDLCRNEARKMLELVSEVERACGEIDARTLASTLARTLQIIAAAPEIQLSGDFDEKTLLPTGQHHEIVGQLIDNSHFTSYIYWKAGFQVVVVQSPKNGGERVIGRFEFLHLKPLPSVRYQTEAGDNLFEAIKTLWKRG